MRFHLAAIDLDGTLLTSAKRLTPRSIEAVRSANADGLIAILCTGRMVRSALHYWHEIGLDTPIIGYNGAQVRDIIGQRDLLLRPVPPDVTRDVLEFCRRERLAALTYQDDRLYVERDDDEVRAYSDVYRVEYQVIEDLARFLANGSTKILVSCEPAACAGVAARFAREFNGRVNVTQSEGRHVEITHPGATKASALAFLAQHFGLRREEIVAFGDGIIDVDMLQYAGLGVAVANAWPEARQAADQVIGRNDDEAVAAFLEALRRSA